MRVLGVIPARRNSKSINGKNIAPLLGRPLIDYTFEVAKAASMLSRIVCTSDCPEVKSLAEQQGIEVISRPAKLCLDETPMVPVLQHALSVSGERFDAVMLLQPTCPLRTELDIDDACRLMEAEEASSVISYVDAGANHPARMVMIQLDQRPYPVWGFDLRFANKQDLPKVYIRSGDVYLTEVETLMRGDLVGDKPRAYIMPAERHCNIDCPRDLEWAEFLMRREAACS